MAKKKSKSNALVALAVFLLVLGVAMIYYSISSDEKGLITSAISSLVIGIVLIVMAKKSKKTKK